VGSGACSVRAVLLMLEASRSGSVSRRVNQVHHVPGVLLQRQVLGARLLSSYPPADSVVVTQRAGACQPQISREALRDQGKSKRR